MKPQQAYRKVRTAIQSGILVRPSECQRCGKSGVASDGRSIIHAHHHDYNKPLDVEWICARCHRKETPLPTVIGGKAVGETNGQSKLTGADVVSIRRLREKGLSFQKIADRFFVDKKTIIRVIKGVCWNHIAAAPEPKP